MDEHGTLSKGSEMSWRSSVLEPSGGLGAMAFVCFSFLGEALLALHPAPCPLGTVPTVHY